MRAGLTFQRDIDDPSVARGSHKCPYVLFGHVTMNTSRRELKVAAERREDSNVAPGVDYLRSSNQVSGRQPMIVITSANAIGETAAGLSFHRA
jgi:hypothetical protein